MPMVPIRAPPHGLDMVHIAADFPLIPIAMDLALTPATPLDMFLADMASMDIVLTRTAPQDMALISAPTLGGV